MRHGFFFYKAFSDLLGHTLEVDLIHVKQKSLDTICSAVQKYLRAQCAQGCCLVLK